MFQRHCLDVVTLKSNLGSRLVGGEIDLGQKGVVQRNIFSAGDHEQTARLSIVANRVRALDQLDAAHDLVIIAAQDLDGPVGAVGHVELILIGQVQNAVWRSETGQTTKPETLLYVDDLYRLVIFAGQEESLPL